jgi:hypothetical protein
MEKELVATYDKDANGQYGFTIDKGRGLTGTPYIPKDEPVSDTITIRLRVTCNRLMLHSVIVDYYGLE